jgi:hypothetical protein
LTKNKDFRSINGKVNIGTHPEKLELQYQMVLLSIFLNNLDNVLMIIKNITSLTGLQTLVRAAWTSVAFQAAIEIGGVYGGKESKGMEHGA